MAIASALSFPSGTTGLATQPEPSIPSEDIPMTTSPPIPNTAGNPGAAEFAQKLTELRDLLADIARVAPAAASETFDGLKNRASALCDNCEEQVTDATHYVAKTVKAHPVQAAMIVVGAGALAWWLLHRCATKPQ